MGIDVEGSQGLVEPPGVLPHFLGAVGTGSGGTAQQFNGREPVGRLFGGVALGNLGGDLLGGLRRLLGGHLAGLLSGILRRDNGLGRPLRLLLLHKLWHLLRNRGLLRLPFGLLLFLLSRLFRGLLHGNAPGNRLGRRAIYGGINIQVDGVHHVRSPGRCSGRGTAALLGRLCLGRGGRCSRLGGTLLLYRLGLRLQLIDGHLHGLTLGLLLLDPLRGNMVHHGGSRLHIVCLFLLPILFSGPLSNGLDKAGDGDLHRAQQGQQSAQAEEQIRNHIAAGPADQHGKAAAEHAAGGPGSAAGIEVRNDTDSLCHALGLHGQMVDAAAEEYKANHAHTAHNRLLLPAEGLNHENLRQSGYGEIKAHLAQQAQDHGFQHLQQGPIRINGDDQEQHKQAGAENRRQNIRRQAPCKILVTLFHLFGIFLFGWGRFAAG